MPEFQITALDIIIVVAYIAGTIGIGIWFSRGKEDAEGYFLGGRNFIWPLVGLSLFATNQSGTSFIGLSSSGYANGIAVFNYEWTGAVILVFFVVFFLPFYIRSRVYTMPEFLEKRFDRRSRYAHSAYTVLAETFIGLSASLYAGGITINLLYPNIPLWVSIVVLGVVAAGYTVVGGPQRRGDYRRHTGRDHHCWVHNHNHPGTRQDRLSGSGPRRGSWRTVQSYTTGFGPGGPVAGALDGAPDHHDLLLSV